MITASMVAAGFCINNHGGAYENGKAYPIQVKATVAAKYFEMEDDLVAGGRVSINALAKACKCGWNFANRVVGEIQNGQLVDPRTVVADRARGVGVLTLSVDDCLHLLALRRMNNRLTLRDYQYRLFVDRGTIVSKTVISDWFLKSGPFRGSLRKLNKVPIDKFTNDNIINRMEYLYRISQVHPWRMVFGDEKPLKGGELFNRWGRADPMTGELEDLVVDSDWRNTYNITGLCRIGRDRPCFSYVIHDGSNNAAAFCDFILSNLASGFLRTGDFLVLDNASIHHYEEMVGMDDYLWNYHGIFLQFLPTRSPELNPIELLWNTLVQRLKHAPLHDPVFFHRVARMAEMLMNAFTHADVEASFRRCGYIV